MINNIFIKLTTIFSNRKYAIAALLVLVVSVALAVVMSQSNNKIQLQASKELTWDEYVVAKDTYVGMARKRDPSFALDSLREQIKKDDKLSHSCHAIVHEIGHEAYEMYGSFSKSMQYQDELCNSGYLHGIIESIFSETKDILKTMNSICGASTIQNFANWQCYHGIGHGLMFFTENNVPDSVKLCEVYIDTFARASCINGVYMENFGVDQDTHVSAYVDKNRPLYPCNEKTTFYKEDCYVYAPTYYLFVHKNDYKGALRMCRDAEAKYRLICVSGVGSQAMKDNSNNPKLVERICLTGKISQIGACISGMATLAVNHYGSTTPVRSLCKDLYFFNRGACVRAVEKQEYLFK
jgi:hypothetical protein